MTTAARHGRLMIRVRLLDTWDELEFDVGPDETVATLKAKALASYRLKRPTNEYEVKLGGRLIADEAVPVGSTGAKDGSSFIVLPKRRRPVR